MMLYMLGDKDNTPENVVLPPKAPLSFTDQQAISKFLRLTTFLESTVVPEVRKRLNAESILRRNSVVEIIPDNMMLYYDVEKRSGGGNVFVSEGGT